MAQIGLNITASGFSGKLLIRWLRAANPLAEVGRSDAFDFPYDDVYTITDLAPVVYIVQLWRSDDGIALDQLLKDWSIDASKQTVNSITTYQYKVGRGWDNTTPDVTEGTWADPVDTDVNLVDTRLDGFTKEQMIVHEAGYGNKLDSEYDLISGGGIELLGGKTFDQDVAWFITVSSSEVVTIPSTDGGFQLFENVNTITSDVDLYTDDTDNYYNQLILVEGAGTTVTATMPDLSLIPDGTHFLFNTNFGSQNYFRLQLDAGDTIKWFNEEVNYIDIARNEILWIYVSGGVARVLQYSGNYLRRGSVMPGYDSDLDTDRGNLIYADESTGELSKDDYPGLYDFAEQLTGESVCNLGTALGEWSYDSGGGIYPNKRKWGIDTVAFTFRVPHLSGMVAKYSSTPGVYEADDIGPHTITWTGSYYVYGTTGKGNLGSSSQDAVKNSSDNRAQTLSVTTGSSETKVKSYSQKPFIYL